MANKPKAKAKAGTTYQGTVDGIDVHAYAAQPVRCFAFINKQPGDYIQVVTYEPQLQAALELASSKQCEVEVDYEDDGTSKSLLRVRLLDR
jgi:hypothetical protein